MSVSATEPIEENHWYLFNDFLVDEISKDEALRFRTQWKNPCVLSYQARHARHAVDESWKENLDTTLLFYEWSMKYGPQFPYGVPFAQQPTAPVHVDLSIPHGLPLALWPSLSPQPPVYNTNPLPNWPALLPPPSDRRHPRIENTNPLPAWPSLLPSPSFLAPHLYPNTDGNYSLSNGHTTKECRILDPQTEAPTAGTRIALDTEFIALEKEEIDMKGDGVREIVRPQRSGLARVSVVRASEPEGSQSSERGQQESSIGVPFIDDYIHVTEPVVDYLTKYSGIRPTDLSPRTSTHNLVPLKVAYKKLWLLLNLGCVFIGHGLSSDFRKINIQVPENQRIDTQFLYFIPSKNRRLSLKYLAWAVLNEWIQEEDVEEGHDSIEDARMAMRLQHKWEEFKREGIHEQVLEELYREGHKFSFKPPQRVRDPVTGELVEVRGPLPGGVAGRPYTPDIVSAPSTPGRKTVGLAAAGGTLTPGGGGLGSRKSFESPLK